MDLLETEDGKRVMDEYMACTKNHLQKYSMYPLSVACVAGLFYRPKGSVSRIYMKKIMLGYAIWFMGTLVCHLKGMSNCRPILVAEINRRKEAEERRNILGDNESLADLSYYKPHTDSSLPKTSVDDPFFSGFQPSIYDDFKPYREEVSNPKKSGTYDDLWEVERKKDELWENSGRMYDDNFSNKPKPQRYETNKYGDRIN